MKGMQTIHLPGLLVIGPWANAEAEVPTIWMVGFRTTREETQGIYNEVYQLKMLLGSPYGPEQMEALDM